MNKLVDKYGYDLQKIIEKQRAEGHEDVALVCEKAQIVELNLIDAANKGENIENSPKLYWLRRFWNRLVDTANSGHDVNGDGFVLEDEIINLNVDYLDGKITPKISVE